jgi:hypothetical protein
MRLMRMTPVLLRMHPTGCHHGDMRSSFSDHLREGAQKRLYVGRWPAETIETQILSMQRQNGTKMYNIHGYDGMEKD